MKRKCGIINPDNPCRCARRIDYAIETRRVDPEKLLFAGDPGTHKMIRAEVKRLDELKDSADLLRSNPDYRSPEKLRQELRKLCSAGGPPAGSPKKSHRESY